MENIKFGLFLTQLRKEKGLTQNQLAEKLNVTHQAVSKWETSDSIPDVSILMNIAQIFNLSVDELLKGEKKDIEPKQMTHQDNAIPNVYSLLKLIFSGIVFLSFLFPFYKETTSISDLTGINISLFSNLEPSITYNGFGTLFHPHGFIFVGVFLLFLGMLSLLFISITKFIEDYHVKTPLSIFTKEIKLSLLNLIVCSVSALGALIAFVSDFQIGGFIALLFVGGYYLTDFFETKYADK